MESGDKPQTNIDGLRAESTFVVREKDWNDLKASEARKKKLLEKHEWAGWCADYDGMPLGEPHCLECFNDKPEGHTDSCALAAELEDTEGG